VFGVLDKLGSPKWGEILRGQDFRATEDRAQTALLLGTVIADGFIAVEAENKKEVKEIGRQVLKLAGAIGVRQSVIARSNSIIEAADKSEWIRVRREFDGALQDVKHAMLELRDEELAQLVSLGGWLRGTQALSLVVVDDFTADGAELINQPSLMKYFSSQIGEMKPRLKENKLVAEIQSQLEVMQTLIVVPDGRDISAETVKEICEITTGLVEAISSV